MMKSDQEFLDGVYAKARRMQAEEEAKAPAAQPSLAARWGRSSWGSRSSRSRWAMAAALFILAPAVILTSLYLTGVIGYRKIVLLRSFNPIDFQILSAQSELIVQGHFVGFSPGVYVESENSLYTDALFQIDESFKGQAGGLISLRLQGGKDPVYRVFADLEIDGRSTGIARLLFLKMDPAGFYRLYPDGSSCFDAGKDPGTFINRDQVKITLDQITNLLEGDD